MKAQHRCHHEGCPDSGGYIGNVAATLSAASMKMTHIVFGMSARHAHPSPRTRPQFFCGRHRPRVLTGQRILETREAQLRGIIRP